MYGLTPFTFTFSEFLLERLPILIEPRPEFKRPTGATGNSKMNYVTSVRVENTVVAGLTFAAAATPS